ncbi:MAG TPA: PilZ domain-containing protein [Steroidobacteraceae bacterium]|nr:PilZ domain-containing protein [Steroidobacteraceae bacterium]
MDHRWGHRIAIDLPIRVMHPGISRCEPGRLSNISLGGALIKSPLDSAVGARLQLAITVPCGEDSYESVIDAYLVRRSAPGLGIEWAHFAPIEVIDLVRAVPSAGTY